MAKEKEKPEATPETNPELTPEANSDPAPERKPEQQGVKVTKGGISKYVDLSQVATYKANGWK